MTAQISAMIPQFVPLTQAAGQQVVLDMPGTNPHESILLTMAQLLVQGTKLPQSATMPGTSLKSDFRGGNQLDKINSTDGIKSENVSKEEKKADIVFTLGSSTLSAEEQLKKFVSSSQASRNQAYYVVVNKGETNERAFFIEPNKKGKSKPNTEKKIKTEKNDDSLVKTLDTVKTEPDKKPVKVEQEVVVPDSSSGDPEPQNKFLKFCQLPKTPAKVPVAAVTPQRQSEQENKNRNCLICESNDVNSDEEFLNTRRRGGRKRKSTSKFQEWSKRSRKGVTYDDNENTDEKENKAKNECLSCIKCGKQLLPLGQYEKQKKHPEFLSCVFKKNTELIYFPNMKTKDCQLQTVESETNNK
ncbi:uncharacterized protein LOC132734673, partial [Ruditapes philippinarum]|uniref:uncharacterized protein LOC132734673 n=1 Tax=Ruditapes philippinarum TaxID=129788 RepID=UPI00295ADE9C